MSELAEVLDDILECSVCLNRLQEPKRLPCGHIFCKKCLVPLRAKVCPKCRHKFNTEIGDLPTDLTTVKLLESCNHRQDCRDCESHFAIQCCHCFVKLCEKCLKIHMNEILLERARFFDGNLPKDLDIFLENNDQFRAELLTQVNANIEAAREKATSYLNFHYDEVQRIWDERMNKWNDSQLTDVKSVHVTLQSCMYDLYRFKAGKPDPELSQLNKLYEETEQVKAAVEQLQSDLDRTVAELVGLQWKMIEISKKSRKGMEEVLNPKQVTKAAPETSLSDNMSEVSDDPWEDSLPVHESELEEEEDAGSENSAEEEVGFAEREDSQSPVRMAIQPTELSKKIKSKPPELDAFEERRFRYWGTLSERVEQDDNKAQEPPPHITLYSHRVTGLFTTPPLTFSLLNTLTDDEPAKFPAPDDDDQPAKFPAEDDDDEPAKFPTPDDDEKGENHEPHAATKNSADQNIITETLKYQSGQSVEGSDGDWDKHFREDSLR